MRPQRPLLARKNARWCETLVKIYNFSSFDTKSVRKIVREWTKDSGVRSVIVQNTKIRKHANEEWAQEWFADHSKKVEYSGVYCPNGFYVGKRNGYNHLPYVGTRFISGPAIIARISHLDYLPVVLLHELKHYRGVDHRDMDYEDELGLAEQAKMLINLGRMAKEEFNTHEVENGGGKRGD